MDILGILVDALLFLFIIASILSIAYLSFRDFRYATVGEKMEMVRRLVVVAEQNFPKSGSGNLRFTYVINLLSQRYPKAEYDDLAELIQAAVYELNQAKRSKEQ